MIEAPVYTQKGTKGGKVTLPEELFNLPWNDALVHQVVVSYLANERQSVAHTKFRSEVRGGGHKPWKQKGTGRARHGSRRSPIWVGGGITFGPRSDKQYKKVINKKMRSKAFFTALSQKTRDGSIAFIDTLSFSKPSTKDADAFITSICDERKGKSFCALVFADKDEQAIKSFANIKGVKTYGIDTLNTKDIVEAKKIVFVGTEKVLKQLELRLT